jgi:hypothetical protein
MSGGLMPYVMDKGPYLSVLEDILKDGQRRTHVLAQLRANTALASLVGLDSANLFAGDNKQPIDRVKILNEKWFGMTLEPNGWQKDDNAFPTGFWFGYQGDPEKILREGLERAIEVSLGIDHSDIPNDPIVATRTWTFELIWICQGPFFQCWVTWIEDPGLPGQGHVTLTITTPASEGLAVNPKIQRTNLKPGYASPPEANAWTAPRGVWVVGHPDYTKTPSPSTTGSRRTRIHQPALEWRRTTTDVVCVAPAEWEGGVLAIGRPYLPPAGP